MSTPQEDDPFGWVGATVDGKYRVDEVVGHGGFGIVYRAHHLGFEEKVALKCLKLPKELQGGDRDRFRDSLVAEGRLLLQLSRATTGVVQAFTYRGDTYIQFADVARARPRVTDMEGRPLPYDLVAEYLVLAGQPARR